MSRRHLGAPLEPRAVPRTSLTREIAPRWGHEQCGHGHGGWMMLRGAGRAHNRSRGLIQRGERRLRSRLTCRRDCSFHGPLCRRMSHLGERNCSLLGGYLQRIISARKVTLFWQDTRRAAFLRGWQIILSATLWGGGTQHPAPWLWWPTCIWVLVCT